MRLAQVEGRPRPAPACLPVRPSPDRWSPAYRGNTRPRTADPPRQEVGEHRLRERPAARELNLAAATPTSPVHHQRSGLQTRPSDPCSQPVPRAEHQEGHSRRTDPPSQTVTRLDSPHSPWRSAPAPAHLVADDGEKRVEEASIRHAKCGRGGGASNQGLVQSKRACTPRGSRARRPGSTVSRQLETRAIAPASRDARPRTDGQPPGAGRMAASRRAGPADQPADPAVLTRGDLAAEGSSRAPPGGSSSRSARVGRCGPRRLLAESRRSNSKSMAVTPPPAGVGGP